MSLIFISYRRRDTQGTAREIHRELSRYYGGEKAIFLDEKNIQKGDNIVDIIRDKLGQCDIFLPLIDSNWVKSFIRKEDIDELDEGTWQDPNDWVALEIIEALQIEKLEILPVLIDVNMPKSYSLPHRIKAISSRNALELKTDSFYEQIPVIINTIDELIKGVVMTIPEKEDGKRQRYRHEVKYCINNGGGDISNISKIYLQTLAEYFNLNEETDELFRLQISEKQPYKLYSDVVRKMIFQGHTRYRGDEIHFSSEAKRHLRRLNEILELPRWKVKKVEGEATDSLKQKIGEYFDYQNRYLLNSCTLYYVLSGLSKTDKNGLDFPFSCFLYNCFLSSLLMKHKNSDFALPTYK